MKEAIATRLNQQLGGLIGAMTGAKVDYQQPYEPTPKEIQMKLKFNENVIIQQKKHKLLQEVKENDAEVELEADTYTMAFKALHYESMQQMGLNPDDVFDAFQAAISVFFLQMILIGILALIVMTGKDGFSIKLPTNIYVLVARFVCSILMHLQVESDMRQGLQMMKYVTNHREDFSNPNYAFFVALMQSLGGMGSEVFCIIFLCSLTDPITILIRFIAFASIGKIDNWYASALDPNHRLCRESDPLKVKNHRFEVQRAEDEGEKKGEKSQTCEKFILRFIYKTVRIVYVSFIFYFLPYMALFYPQMAA